MDIPYIKNNNNNDNSSVGSICYNINFNDILITQHYLITWSKKIVKKGDGIKSSVFGSPKIV